MKNQIFTFLCFLLFLCYSPKSQAQEKQQFLMDRYEPEYEIINKSTTKKELKKLEEKFAKQGLSLSITNVRYNKNKEITKIKIKAYYKGHRSSMEWSSTEPIDTIKIGIVNDEVEIIPTKEAKKLPKL